jgi:hypothetical protein
MKGWDWKSRTFTLFEPYAVLACPDLHSTGFLSPGLIRFGSITFEVRPNGLDTSLIFNSFSWFLLARLQYILSANIFLRYPVRFLYRSTVASNVVPSL